MVDYLFHLWSWLNVENIYFLSKASIRVINSLMTLF
jgi:hypothetical protein